MVHFIKYSGGVSDVPGSARLFSSVSCSDVLIQHQCFCVNLVKEQEVLSTEVCDVCRAVT